MPSENMHKYYTLLWMVRDLLASFVMCPEILPTGWHWQLGCFNSWIHCCPADKIKWHTQPVNDCNFKVFCRQSRQLKMTIKQWCGYSSVIYLGVWWTNSNNQARQQHSKIIIKRQTSEEAERILYKFTTYHLPRPHTMHTSHPFHPHTRTTPTWKE